MLSRRHEREADRFASDLTGTPEAMSSALVKLSRENLSNLHPHPCTRNFIIPIPRWWRESGHEERGMVKDS